MDTILPLDKHVEIMAFGERPCDVEKGVGGILLKMAHRGYTTVICDLSGQGKTEEDADRAAKILHVSERVNLGFETFNTNFDAANIEALAKCISLYRPDIIIAPYWKEWDTENTPLSGFIHRALEFMFLQRSSEIYTQHMHPWVFYYPSDTTSKPQIVVNINSTFEAKIEAIKVYESGFKEILSPNTPFSLNHRDYLFHIETSARYFGSFINCRFGEGLVFNRPLSIDDICEFTSP